MPSSIIQKLKSNRLRSTDQNGYLLKRNTMKANLTDTRSKSHYCLDIIKEISSFVLLMDERESHTEL